MGNNQEIKNSSQNSIGNIKAKAVKPSLLYYQLELAASGR